MLIEKLMNNYFSKEYKDTLEIYKKLHLNGTELDSAENTFDGKSLKFFFQSIKQVIDLTKSKSVIDFGCGKAKYYFENIKIDNVNYNNIVNFWEIQKYFLYDPGIESFSKYQFHLNILKIVSIHFNTLVFSVNWIINE